jgi:dTDP-4-amino-4,6-dideoxy-D-galactose acyltransferase
VKSAQALAVEPCELLRWDTEHFGVRIGRVRARRLDGTALDDALEWADAQAIACLYLLVDSDDPHTLRLAASRGLRFVDVRVSLGRALGEMAHVPVPDGVLVRPAQDEDAPALVAMAAAGHEDTRFHADGRFDAGAVERLYAQWMRGSLDGTLADVVLVAQSRDELVGYITVSRERRLGRIGLVGVARVGRGAGVGRALVLCALRHCAAAGLEALEVVTQGRNVAAQRLYEACGFRVERTQIWFHGWADERRAGS